jgi:hypothetical protein
MKNILCSALTIAALALPLTAHAAIRTDEQTLHGTIASIDGKFGLTVRDERADADLVRLHPGTVIDPTGLRLQPGMHVTITGRPDGNAFDAKVIAAPAESVQVRQREPLPNLDQPTPNGTFQTQGPSAEGGG